MRVPRLAGLLSGSLQGRDEAIPRATQWGLAQYRVWFLAGTAQSAFYYTIIITIITVVMVIN